MATRGTFPRVALLALTALLTATLGLALRPGTARASSRQVTIVEESNGVAANPMATFEKLKSMGVNVVKFSIDWQYLLPAREQSATKMPAALKSPSGYYRSFADLAQIDADAQKVGIGFGFLVGAPIPRWAETSFSGCTPYGVQESICHPSAADFKVFMTALGTYFNGSRPGVPAVRFWSIWNEPNYGVNISPQVAKFPVYSGADEYRSLVQAAWSALTSTGHTTRSDTILFGDLAPRGISSRAAGNTEGIKPIQFLASLYCVRANGRRLTGKVASENACPSSAAAFKRENPALFDASGMADHPYGQGVPPTQKTGDCMVGVETFCVASRKYPADPLWTDLASISTLEASLNRDLGAYGDHRKLPIWNTEYGDWTSPPGSNPCHNSEQDDCDVSPAKAEIYLNQAEYMSWRDPRIASFDQYQLYMPASGGWTDGLLHADGAPEPTYDAWELPLWVPDSSLPRAGDITVWGGVKPATYEQDSAGVRPLVSISYQTGSSPWTTLATVTVPTGSTHPGSYFQTRVDIPASGTIRLVYRFGKSSLVSRPQAITVK